jgi:predicted nucleotide-binding protein
MEPATQMTRAMNEAAAETSAQAAQQSEPDVELLLASANAIQRLVAERRALRDRVATLENELRSLRTQATVVHDSYRTLTEEFVTQFKLIDSAVSNLFQAPAPSASASPPEQPSVQTPGSDRSSAAA